MIRGYTLGPEEIDRVLEAGGPLVEMQADPQRLKDMSIAVVEADGQIVAYWVVWYALHCEPLWVKEEYRKSPAVIRGIVQQMEVIVEATGEPAAFCVIEQHNAEVVAQYAVRLGFHEPPTPGSLYYIVVQPVEPVKV